MKHTFVQINEDRLFLELRFDGISSLVFPREYGSFADGEGRKCSMQVLIKFMGVNMDWSKVALTHILNDNFEEGQSSFINQIVDSKEWQIQKINKGLDLALQTRIDSRYIALVGLIRFEDTAVFMLSISAFDICDIDRLIFRMINNNWKRKFNGWERK